MRSAARVKHATAAGSDNALKVRRERRERVLDKRSVAFRLAAGEELLGSPFEALRPLPHRGGIDSSDLIVARKAEPLREARKRRRRQAGALRLRAGREKRYVGGWSSIHRAASRSCGERSSKDDRR